MAILKKLSWIVCWAFFLFGVTVSSAKAERNTTEGTLLILCYHSVLPEAPPDDPYTISHRQFADQMDYLHAHGYRPVSLEQLHAALNGGNRLPDNSVLISFDDAYQSYYDFVVPLLALYGYPSIQAVVGSWIENGPPEGLPEPLMTWPQIRELSQSPLVTIVSHSYDLHKADSYTPQGNVGPIVGVRRYIPEHGRYATEEEYRNMLQIDFEMQKKLFLQHIGHAPQAIVWPYGHYNAISVETAFHNGLDMGFVLDEKELGKAQLSTPGALNRLMIYNKKIDEFIRKLKSPAGASVPMRAMQVDLDLICEPGDDAQTDHNLGKLIDRLMALDVNTVFLQAFADPEGDGNIHEVYFQNRVLPVRADILGHAVHQMRVRGIKVYAWMPTLSYVFPDPEFNRLYRVREYKNERLMPSNSWYERLTPFSSEVLEKVAYLFEDLAAGSQISGILFQDDAYLTDFEDFHSLAVESFAKHMDRPLTPSVITDDPELSEHWIDFKTARLIDFIEGLSTAVRKFRPDARFARNLYSRVITMPHSQAWFAMNYDLFLKHYDYVVVMAYPRMENARRPLHWLVDLAQAAQHPQMRKKTVFKLQAYDWQRNTWVDDQQLLKEMRTVLGAGIRHIAYYPDNLWDGKPDLTTIRLEMSTRDSVKAD